MSRSFNFPSYPSLLSRLLSSVCIASLHATCSYLTLRTHLLPCGHGDQDRSSSRLPPGSNSSSYQLSRRRHTTSDRREQDG